MRAKETYSSIKGYLHYQKRPTLVSKDTYSSIKRDLLIHESKRDLLMSKRDLFIHEHTCLAVDAVNA
jgi:hypothetical protein